LWNQQRATRARSAYLICVVKTGEAKQIISEELASAGHTPTTIGPGYGIDFSGGC